MQLLLTFALLGVIVNSQTFAADPAAGPTSPEEAAILWKDASAAAADDRILDVIPKLQRLLARYPSGEHTLDAELLLARAWIDLDNFAEAIPLLKKALTASPRPRAGESAVQQPQNAARILLTRAYLGLDRFSETLLTAAELLRSSDPEIQRKGRLARGWAELGQRRIERANTTLAEIETRSPAGSPAGKDPETQTFALALSLQRCSKLGGGVRLTEDQVKDQLQRRGLCLAESALILEKIATVTDLHQTAFMKNASERITHSAETFLDRCQEPPEPPSPPRRSKEQLSRYRSELVDQLWPLCRAQLTLLAEQLSRLSSKAPSTAQPFFQFSISALDQLRARSIKP